VFEGPAVVSLDAKSRMMIPTRYHGALMDCAQGQIAITKHPHGCLLVFPRPQWLDFREHIKELPLECAWWKRVFVGHVVDTVLDSTGRVLLPAVLREAAGIQREILLLGVGTHFEVWDKASYAAKESEAFKMDMPESLKRLIF